MVIGTVARKIGTRGSVWLGAAMLLAPSSAWATSYIVKFKDVSALTATSVAQHANGFAVLDTHREGQLAKITVDAKDKAAVSELARLIDSGETEYVVEDFPLHTLGVPNDPNFSQQWALPKVNAPAAWDRGVGSRSVVVAIIDTGVDYRHPDLAANIWTSSTEIAGNGVDDDGNGLVDDVHGWDFLANDADPNDETSSQNPGHGTHCAGIVGAVGDNGIGVSGINQMVSIMPLRFIGPNGQGDLMAAIKAIDYAIAKHVDVISASWGAQVAASQAQPLIEAVNRASAAGVTFVAAAANNGANNDTTDMYPANVEAVNMIAVAASDPNDAKPSWSNYGKGKVHLSSPGLDIFSTLPNSSYNKLSGTSMATPLVAGLVALMKSQAKGELSGAQARAVLQMTGAQVAIETACMCRVDAEQALAALASDKLMTVPAAATLVKDATSHIDGFGGSGAGYLFTSANPAVVEVSADGTLTAKSLGETTVMVKDSQGGEASSLAFRVVEAGGGGGGGGGECPLGDPMTCQLMCQIMPQLPWCTK